MKTCLGIVAAAALCACSGGGELPPMPERPPDLEQTTFLLTGRFQATGGSEAVGESFELLGVMPVKQAAKHYYLLVLLGQLQHGSADRLMEIRLGADVLAPGDYDCVAGQGVESMNFDLGERECHVFFVNDTSRRMLEESWFPSSGSCSIHVSEVTTRVIDEVPESFRASVECREMLDRKTVQFPDNDAYPGPLPTLTLTGTIEASPPDRTVDVNPGTLDASITAAGGDGHVPPTLALWATGPSITLADVFNMTFMSDDSAYTVDVAFRAPYEIVGEYSCVTPAIGAPTWLDPGTCYLHILDPLGPVFPEASHDWVSITEQRCTLSITAGTYDRRSPFVRGVRGRFDCTGMRSVDEIIGLPVELADLELHGTFQAR